MPPPVLALPPPAPVTPGPSNSAAGGLLPSRQRSGATGSTGAPTTPWRPIPQAPPMESPTRGVIRPRPESITPGSGEPENLSRRLEDVATPSNEEEEMPPVPDADDDEDDADDDLWTDVVDRPYPPEQLLGDARDSRAWRELA